MPVFDMMESLLVKKMKFAPGLKLRLISRSVYVGNAPLNFFQLSSSSQASVLMIQPNSDEM
jgi:hypothetical protein